MAGDRGANRAEDVARDEAELWDLLATGRGAGRTWGWPFPSRGRARP